MLYVLRLVLVILLSGSLTYIYHSYKAYISQPQESHNSNSTGVIPVENATRILIISEEPDLIISKLRCLHKTNCDSSTDVPSKLQKVSIWIYLPVGRQYEQQQVQNIKQRTILGFGNQVLKKVQILFINDLIQKELQGVQLAESLIKNRIWVQGYDAVLLDSNLIKQNQEFMGLIKQQFNLAEQTNGVVIIKIINKQHINQTVLKICSQTFQELVSVSTQSELETWNPSPLLLTASPSRISALDSTSIFPTICSPTFSYLSLSNITQLQVLVSEIAQQNVEILRTLISIAYFRKKAMKDKSQQGQKNIVKVKIPNNEFRKIFQRNLVLNDIQATLEVETLSEMEVKGVIISQLSLFYDKIQQYRHLILSNNTKFIIYFDGLETTTMTSLANQFRVHKIDSSYMENFILHKPEQPPKQLAFGLYLIQGPNRSQTHKASSPEALSHSDKYGIQFQKESGQEQGQAYQPLWRIQDRKRVPTPSCFLDRSPQIGAYFFYANNKHKENDFLKKIQESGVNWIILWCLDTNQALFYQIGVSKYKVIIAICNNVKSEQRKKLIRIAILNDFGSIIIRDGTHASVNAIFVQQSYLNQNKQEWQQIEHTFIANYSECKLQKIQSFCYKKSTS